jgi:rubredoxin
MHPATEQDPRPGRPARERVPVAARCPTCNASRLIYTTVRSHLQVVLMCPECRARAASRAADN